MKKSRYIWIGLIIVLSGMTATGIWMMFHKEEEPPKTERFSGVVRQYDNGSLTLQNKEGNSWSCHVEHASFHVDDTIDAWYIRDNETKRPCQIVYYEYLGRWDDVPQEWQDNGIFATYYKSAYRRLKEMSLEEKIGQVLLVRYPDNDPIAVLHEYHLGGYLFFGKDFQGKSESQVKAMIQAVQDASSIPLLTAIDEEGGIVVRASSNPYLRSSSFASPSVLYDEGGFERIRADTLEKSAFLDNLGLNLNLAPVVDVAESATDYMYERTLKQNTALTCEYARVVIQAGSETNVSYAMKHFPGYGNNADTHVGGAYDTRSYEDLLQNDIPPFTAGIEAGGEAILVSHNVVSSMDDTAPASLSPAVHRFLREELGFSGVIITDDIAMDALGDISDTGVKAMMAGNDLIITTDYAQSFASIKNAIEDGTLEEEQLDHAVFRLLAWKYAKQLISDR